MRLIPFPGRNLPPSPNLSNPFVSYARSVECVRYLCVGVLCRVVARMESLKG